VWPSSSSLTLRDAERMNHQTCLLAVWRCYLEDTVVVSDGVLRDVELVEIFDEQHEEIGEDGLTDVVVVDKPATLPATFALSSLVVPDVLQLPRSQTLIYQSWVTHWCIAYPQPTSSVLFTVRTVTQHASSQRKLTCPNYRITLPPGRDNIPAFTRAN